MKHAQTHIEIQHHFEHHCLLVLGLHHTSAPHLVKYKKKHSSSIGFSWWTHMFQHTHTYIDICVYVWLWIHVLVHVCVCLYIGTCSIAPGFCRFQMTEHQRTNVLLCGSRVPGRRCWVNANTKPTGRAMSSVLGIQTVIYLRLGELKCRNSWKLTASRFINDSNKAGSWRNGSVSKITHYPGSGPEPTLGGSPLKLQLQGIQYTLPASIVTYIHVHIPPHRHRQT